jgi:hypothetical protein
VLGDRLSISDNSSVPSKALPVCVVLEFEHQEHFDTDTGADWMLHSIALPLEGHQFC